MYDTEPSMNKIDDFHKPMPRAKRNYMIKFITVVLIAAIIITTAETLLIK